MYTGTININVTGKTRKELLDNIWRIRESIDHDDVDHWVNEEEFLQVHEDEKIFIPEQFTGCDDFDSCDACPYNNNCDLQADDMYIKI